MSARDMRLHAAACSTRGTARAVNQDHVAVHMLDDQVLLAVIADGVGSYTSSGVASELAASLVCTHVEQARQSVRGHGARRATLKQAVQAANLALWQHAIECEQPMKTTLSALLCTPNEALLAHVGDCRIYLLRAGMVRLLTQDHSWAREPSWWRWLPLATPGAPSGHARHSLTRVLGDQPIVRVDTTQFPIQPLDCFMLCSDGIWSSVSPATFATLAAEQEDEAALAHTLVCEAQARGSTDDASAIVVSLGKMSVAESGVGSPPGTYQPLGAVRNPLTQVSVYRLG